MKRTGPNQFDILLMIDRNTGALFPFSSHGFRWAQGNYAALVQRCSDCIFLDKNGSVLTIENVRPAADNFAAKLKRLAGSAYRIETELKPLQIELPALKRLILTGVNDYRSRMEEDGDGWAFMTLPYSEIELLVLNAADTKSLYDVLALPDAADCLDLL